MASVETTVASMNNNQEKVEAFFDGWALYRKILRENYMFHKEIYEAVKEQLIAQKPGSEKIRFLDLGCGDADYISGIFETVPVDAYTGIDLSQVALDEARANLSTLSMKKQFQQDDLLNYLESCDQEQSFDVILASYSVHHLSREDKQRFFEYCQGLLAPEGRLFFIDESRYSDETREGYLERWWAYMERDCPKLTAEEKQFIREHMASSDFPEPLENHIEMALEADFTFCRELYADPHDLHRFLVCRV